MQALTLSSDYDVIENMWVKHDNSKNEFMNTRQT